MMVLGLKSYHKYKRQPSLLFVYKNKHFSVTDGLDSKIVLSMEM